MILLGMYTTKDGKNYDCHFLPGEKIAQAVGPLPDRVGVSGVAFEVRAESEQEARQKIAEVIGQWPGKF